MIGIKILPTTIFPTQYKLGSWSVPIPVPSQKKSTDFHICRVQNKFALGVFLDIQGAFDNVSVDAVIKGMQEKNFPEIFINWYRSYLKYRTVTINQEGVKVKRFLTRGTPQGGLLSPLAWNLAFESL